VIPPAAREALQAALGRAVRFDAPTHRLTSLRVGGPADALAQPEDRQQLAGLLRICARHHLPHRVIGRGFNTIVRDEGLDGVLIQLSRFRRLEERPGGRLLVEAGVTHTTLTRFCRTHGLAGLEFGAGIPGSLGGWIAMNAGIPERETKDVVCALEVMSPTGTQRSWLPRELLHFRYRALQGLAPGSVVLAALLCVRPARPSEVAKEIDRTLARRSDSQPIDQPSCGSVFKNPPHGFAGRLIEAAGMKGERFGGAAISGLHANFIVNCGEACASDVLALIGKARAAVRCRTGIELQPEVRIWGRKRA